MTNKADKTRRVKEVRSMIMEFAKGRLDGELAGFAVRLVERLGRMRKLDITRGRPEIWAGSVVYVIARLNFLFDRQNPLYLTGDEIAAFFGAGKSTIQNKAGVVEKACRLRQGHPDYSRAEIADMFTTVELPGGLVMPMGMFKLTLAAKGLTAETERDGTIRVREKEEDELADGRVENAYLDDEESRELERRLAERDRERAAVKARERDALNRERQMELEEKRRRERDRQPDLFDWSEEKKT